MKKFILLLILLASPILVFCQLDSATISTGTELGIPSWILTVIGLAVAFIVQKLATNKWVSVTHYAVKIVGFIYNFLVFVDNKLNTGSDAVYTPKKKGGGIIPPIKKH